MMTENPNPFAACTRFLSGHGPRMAADQLQMALSQAKEEERSDIYGKGELIESFEENMAGLLGQEAAVFMPSGTMAQQIALRVWADQSACKRFAMHATSHLEIHEQGAYKALHGLEAQLLADSDRLFDLKDLQALQGPLSSILWELPQREIGGQLPSWEDLKSQTQWAKGQKIRCHLDGARLWEAAPHYGKSHAEIAGLFHSVYVSFYKGLGGIAGAVLAGPADFVQSARIWLRRHGGNLISLHPYVLSARAGLEKHLDHFSAYAKRAQQIAARLDEIDGIQVVPKNPPTCMMHLHLQVEADVLNQANEALAQKSGVMLFGKASPLPDGKSKVELSMGSACDSLSDDEVANLFQALMSQAR